MLLFLSIRKCYTAMLIGGFIYAKFHVGAAVSFSVILTQVYFRRRAIYFDLPCYFISRLLLDILTMEYEAFADNFHYLASLVVITHRRSDAIAVIC